MIITQKASDSEILKHFREQVNDFHALSYDMPDFVAMSVFGTSHFECEIFVLAHSAQHLPVPPPHKRNAPSLPKAKAKGIDGALGSSLCSLAHSTALPLSTRRLCRI
jgi:hypothetical protein